MSLPFIHFFRSVTGLVCTTPGGRGIHRCADILFTLSLKPDTGQHLWASQVNSRVPPSSRNSHSVAEEMTMSINIL